MVNFVRIGAARLGPSLRWSDPLRPLMRLRFVRFFGSVVIRGTVAKCWVCKSFRERVDCLMGADPPAGTVGLVVGGDAKSGHGASASVSYA